MTTIWMHGRAVKLASESSGCAPPEVPPAQQCCVEVSVQDTRREQRGFPKKDTTLSVSVQLAAVFSIGVYCRI